MIYVTVGTMFLDFERLVSAMDDIALATTEEVVVQTGLGTYKPAYCRHFDFKPREACMELQRQARVIVTHAGIGGVTDALAAKRPFVVVPRLKKFREHLNDHQLELARAVEQRGWGRVVLNIADLPAACANPLSPPENYAPARQPLVDAIRGDIQRLLGTA